MATMSKAKIADAAAAAYFEGLDRVDDLEVRGRQVVSDIERAVRARAEAEAEIERAVVQARAEGATWVEIATALGVSHQAAMKRFRDRVEAGSRRVS